MTRLPPPGARSPIDLWAQVMRAEVADDSLQHDPDFVSRLLPWMEAFSRWFAADVRGFEHIPEDRPALLVGNHSGGVLTPDTTALLSAWYRQRGVQTPLVGLAFDAAFGIPGFRVILRKLGLVPASPGAARRSLDSGHSVLVYPGGAHEVFRPWTDRNRVDFDGHKGFVRLALSSGVPVVPVVGHGGHETTVVLARGASLAKRFRYERLRLGVMPLMLQFPWGISTPAMLGMPLPAKITVQIGAPLDWSAYGPDAAEDPAIVNRCYEEITTLMQDTLDQLARETPRPLLARLSAFVSGRRGA